jgi:hypothetical protein
MMHPMYKQKVRENLDQMIKSGIIEPVEESKWINPMVVQEKEQGGIIIFIDLRKLNDAFLHDLFPTPFTNEILEKVEGQGAYSFMDGFSSYHQIKIAPEDRHKTTFSIEWGSY